MKRYLFLIIFTFVLISTGCSEQDNKVVEASNISINSDSEYVKTFKKLNLGIVFDFDFYLPNADKRWVTLWVERYNKGEKDSKTLAQLSYGNSPKEVEKGHLGFGMINPNSEDALVFLYGPGVSTQPSKIKKEFKTDTISFWDYAIQDKKEIDLDLDETKILAVYRQSSGNSFSTIDFQNEEAVQKMIKEESWYFYLR